MNWIYDPDEVAAFGYVLVDTGELESARDVLYYVEKPHKWSPEHELWEAAGRPGDASVTGWDSVPARADQTRRRAGCAMSGIVVFDSAQVPAQLITEADIDWAAEIAEADEAARADWDYFEEVRSCCGGRSWACIHYRSYPPPREWEQP